MRSRIPGFGLFALLLTFLAPRGAFAQSASPAGEGIGVRGQWTVTVVRDGRVVERRAFRNALTPEGEGVLVDLLSRNSSPGFWSILVEADGTGSLCAGNQFVVDPDTDCTIDEISGEATSTGTPTGTLLIAGARQVARDANIVTVRTFQGLCTAAVAPGECRPRGDSYTQFTMKTLDAPIAVQNGDTIEVTVELSFGTLGS